MVLDQLIQQELWKRQHLKQNKLFDVLFAQAMKQRSEQNIDEYINKILRK